MKGEYHYVETCEDMEVDFPDKAETIATGPCLVIGILNKKMKRGYLAHYPDARVDGADRFVDRALKEAKKPGDLEIVLAGNRPDEDIVEDADLGQWMVEVLKSKGLKYLDKMIRGDELGYNVVVDTEKNEIVLEEFD